MKGKAKTLTKLPLEEILNFFQQEVVVHPICQDMFKNTPEFLQAYLAILRERERPKDLVVSLRGVSPEGSRCRTSFQDFTFKSKGFQTASMSRGKTSPRLKGLPSVLPPLVMTFFKP